MVKENIIDELYEKIERLSAKVAVLEEMLSVLLKGGDNY